MLYKIVDRYIENPKVNKRATAVIAMIIASVALSLSGLIIRNIEVANPAQINFYRNTGFVAVIFCIMMIRSRKHSISLTPFGSLPVLYAALGLATTGVCIVQAYTHTLVANTVFIMSSAPFLTMILAYFTLKESVSKLTLIAIVISVFGLAIMIVDGIGSGSNYGNLMALFAAIGFSIFVVVSRAHNQSDLLPALMLAGLIIMAVSFLSTANNLSINLNDLILCLIWGAVISGMAHWVLTLSARYIAAAELTLFGLLETALAPLWVWMLIGETPTIWVLLGGLVIFAAVSLKMVLEMKSLTH